MEVIITGGRYYSDRTQLYLTLDTIRENNEISLIIQGGASGADKLAIEYAELHKINFKTYDAKWKDLSYPDARIKENRYGKYDSEAGPRRNRLMIDSHPNAILIAFKGNQGTRDCIRSARKAGLKVIDIDGPAGFKFTQNVTKTEELVFKGE